MDQQHRHRPLSQPVLANLVLGVDCVAAGSNSYHYSRYAKHGYGRLHLRRSFVPTKSVSIVLGNEHMDRADNLPLHLLYLQ